MPAAGLYRDTHTPTTRKRAMCLYIVLLFQDCQPLIFEGPEAGRELCERALGLANITTFRLQFGDDLLLSCHEARPAGDVTAY